MQAVAQKRFSYLTPDRQLVEAFIGDVVVGFMAWPDNNRRAMLNQRQVSMVEIPAEEAAAEVEVASHAVSPMSAPQPWQCTDCQKVFKSLGGLGIHRAKSHKKL